MFLLEFLFSPLVNAYKSFKYGRLSTFTYFIPAPPQRKSGYREKEFDELVYRLTQLGFHIQSINLQNQSEKGLYVVVLMKAMSAQAQQLKPQDFPIHDLSSEVRIDTTNQDNKVEGLYYID